MTAVFYEHTSQHWFKKLKRFTIKARVESALIVVLAKIDAVFVMRTVTVIFTRVAIPAEIVIVVITLKNGMMFDNPIGLFRHIGFKDSSRHLTVVIGRSNIANVVQ